MVDDTTKVEISKTEIAGSEEIPGRVSLMQSLRYTTAVIKR